MNIKDEKKILISFFQFYYKYSFNMILKFEQFNIKIIDMFFKTFVILLNKKIDIKQKKQILVMLKEIVKEKITFEEKEIFKELEFKADIDNIIDDEYVKNILKELLHVIAISKNNSIYFKSLREIDYAFTHFVRFLKDNDNKQKKKAIAHLKRATLDMYSNSINKFSNNIIDKYREDLLKIRLYEFSIDNSKDENLIKKYRVLFEKILSEN